MLSISKPQTNLIYLSILVGRLDLTRFKCMYWRANPSYYSPLAREHLEFNLRTIRVVFRFIIPASPVIIGRFWYEGCIGGG